MPTAAQRHRSTWLRRTRVITGWIAALAVTATLLIAAVVGSASPTGKVIAQVPARPRAHRAHHHLVEKPRVTPNATPAASTPPAAAPAAAPVVVSGGS